MLRDNWCDHLQNSASAITWHHLQHLVLYLWYCCVYFYLHVQLSIQLKFFFPPQAHELTLCYHEMFVLPTGRLRHAEQIQGQTHASVTQFRCSTHASVRSIRGLQLKPAPSLVTLPCWVPVFKWTSTSKRDNGDGWKDEDDKKTRRKNKEEEKSPEIRLMMITWFSDGLSCLLTLLDEG